MPRLYAILDAYSVTSRSAEGAEPLAIVEATTSLMALDAFALREGFGPYSALVVDPDHEGCVYDRSVFKDGTTLGAVFCNTEIAVYPLSVASGYAAGMEV